MLLNDDTQNTTIPSRKVLRLLTNKILTLRIPYVGISLVIVLVGVLPPVATATDLPNLGDSSAAVISDAEQQALGREFMRGARKQFKFVTDPELTNYLNRLGDLLVANSDAPTEPFQFFLIDNPDLNAFAVPGGFISVHTGLILATESESELAAVLAHEIAHISQRHLPRMIAAAKRQSLPATAALVGAILLGGQAGAAALAATNAALLEAQLRFSRDFEREADNLGIRTLAGSGYDPTAMARFFGRLEQSTRLSESNAPEFLRTHPLSVNRIAESEARALDYPAAPPGSDEEFHHIRAKIRATLVQDTARAAAQFADNLKQGNFKNENAERYGYALALAASSQYEPALAEIEKLILSHVDTPRYHIAYSQIQLQAGQFEQALKTLTDATELFPDDNLLQQYYADALLKTNNAEQAKPILRKQIRHEPKNPGLYQMLARAAGETGAIAESYQALAEYYYLLYDIDQALEQLHTASEHVGDSFYLKASIDARTQELQAEKARINDK